MTSGSSFRRVVLGALVCLAAIVAGTPAALAQTPTSAAGTWTGGITLPPGDLDVTVALAHDDTTRASAGTIDIPAQGGKGLPLANIAINLPSVVFAIASVPGNPTFTGTLSDDGATIAGTFSQAGASFPFTLRRSGPPPTLAAVAPVRPQQPQPPFPYREELVTYRNALPNVALAGTLTLPQGNGPFPAVLLISGSGTQDRDNTILGHKSFLLIADTLTRRGVAVLRVDDRGIGGSDRGLVVPTTEDLAGDVRAGLAYLQTRKDIDGNRIGLIGHSEGATIAAMVAADSPRVAFIVMLAGAGLRGDEVMMRQVAAIAGTTELPPPVIAWDRDMRRRVYDLVMAETGGTPNEAARAAMIAAIPAIPGAPDANSARENAQLLLRGSSSPWWRFFLAYDPAPTLARVRCPVLALIGDRDTQITSAGNIEALRAAFAAGGNTNATVQELPGLNHLFQTSKTGGPAEYASIEETMAPSALTLVADWVLARTK